MSRHNVIPVNPDVREMVQEREKVRRSFAVKGENVTRWAMERGFSPIQVHNVLRGDSACVRGEAHKIAVALGLKPADERVAA